EMILLDEHAHAPGEIARAVGEELDLAKAEMLAPLKHDERVVDRQAIDLVRAGLAERVVAGLEGGALLGGAGRREGPGQREQDDTLAREQVAAADVLPAERVVAADGLVAHAGLEGHVGDGAVEHAGLLLVGGRKGRRGNTPLALRVPGRAARERPERHGGSSVATAI